jgi:hypothetical protein
MILYISEEYGYRDWLVELTQEEYCRLIQRWETMRGLNSLVPVQLIIPQAKEVEDYRLIPHGSINCHIHEHDDSHLYGSDYQIPPDEDFWIEGRRYTDEEIRAIHYEEMNKRSLKRMVEWIIGYIAGMTHGMGCTYINSQAKDVWSIAPQHLGSFEMFEENWDIQVAEWNRLNYYKEQP